MKDLSQRFLVDRGVLQCLQQAITTEAAAALIPLQRAELRGDLRERELQRLRPLQREFDITARRSGSVDSNTSRNVESPTPDGISNSIR